MRLETVGKRYGPRRPWIVRNVSANAAPGTLIRLEGRNGSGKSTLLRVAAGVSRPSRGRVTGRPPTGYVPERFPGALPFTGRGYLLHMARIHGLRGARAAERADEWLERLGATAYADQPLRALSKGMCQKIAIAQALLPSPGLLVLDEAWTGLDQAARGALDAAATERVAAGGTVMFVDHERTRLAGTVMDVWRLDGDGRVTVTRNAGGETDPAAGVAILIEASGLEEDSAARLADLPGVLSIEPRPDASGARAKVVLRVAADRSDQVLRAVLGWDGVHVTSVQPESRMRPTSASEEVVA
ncbi:MAG TPA: ABC transporter ATP-binding protein [Trebonia sp.]|jgi:ABC-type Mn2+/Zn2+ transport system ATPase subunit|nr:ABC transporter ATP-binding protein [Trebonia sp.]